MDLNEYIKMSYKRPNRKVLEGLGASEDLIEYLMETPWNTNWNVLDSIMTPGGEDIGEVWFTGNNPYIQQDEATFGLEGTDEHKTELYSNSNNYRVYVNGTELPYFHSQDSVKAWSDVEMDKDATIAVMMFGATTFYVMYMVTSTVPTSVEVSVKAK